MQTTQLSRVTPSLAPIASQLLEFTRLYSRVLSGITREAPLTRSGPGSNPLICVAVRLVQQRTRLLSALGPPRQIPWENLFVHGAAICDRGLYPTAGEVEAVWRSTSEELMRRIEKTPEECFDKPAPGWLESRDGTLRGGLCDESLHEALDIERMGYLRKCLCHVSRLDAYDTRVDR
jgi:hypothetical protein